MSQSLLKLTISRKSEIEFYENFIIYKGEKILCSDIDAVSYLHTRTKHRVYYVPVGTSHAYIINIRARGIVHKFSFSGENNQDIFSKFVNAIDIIVKPFIVVNLLLDYMKNNELTVGDLTIKPEGLYKKRTWRSPELLSWDQYFNTIVSRGSTFVLKKDNNKNGYSAFYTLSMSALNAVILPDVVNYIFARKGILDEETRKQIIERKTELATASARDAIQGLDETPIANDEMILEEEGEEEAPAEEQATTVRYCKNCGNQAKSGVSFCGNCGTLVGNK
jgi:hypothetical protein